MIKIENQLAVYFSIGDKEDFISPNNLDGFTIYTSAGNLRPIIHLTFVIEDKSIINYLNAGNILTISFGIEDTTKDAIQFELFTDDTTCIGNVGYKTTIKGALYIPRFTSLVKSKTYNGTSVEVLKLLSDEAKLNFKTNITKTDDKQIWYQSGETNWNFVFEPWLHSYINDDTFTVCGFDCYNFYFYDMKSLIQNDVKWIFSPSFPSNNNIVNYSTYTTKNHYGTLAPLVGKNLDTYTINLDNGLSEKSTYNLKNFTVMESDRINLNITNCADYDYQFITSDMHKNYIKAYNQNIRNNTMYSSFCTYISTAFKLFEFKLFDTAFIRTIYTDERLTGVHIITGITYQYTDGVLLTNLTFNKEAPSGIKGEYLAKNE